MKKGYFPLILLIRIANDYTENCSTIFAKINMSVSPGYMKIGPHKARLWEGELNRSHDLRITLISLVFRLSYRTL